MGLIYLRFAIGWAAGEQGLKEIGSFIVNPFKGVLCLFLLDAAFAVVEQNICFVSIVDCDVLRAERF